MTMTMPGNRTASWVQHDGVTQRDQLARRYRQQARGRTWRADLLHVLGMSLFAVAISFFLADGGLSRFATQAQAITSLGVSAGLVATTAMVLMFLLAARVPFIDRTIGHDQALALHRAMGQWTVAGVAVHGLLLVIGYWLTDQLSPLSEFVSLISNQDLELAVASVALLGFVGVTSVIAVKNALPHEVWWVVHLLTYLALLAAIPHQFSMGGIFAGGFSRGWWIAMFAVTGFAVLTFRMVLPLIESLDHRLRVVRVVPEGQGVVSITMRGRRIQDLGASAGQFFHWRFLSRDLWWHQHPFSLSQAPTTNELCVTVRNLGRGTADLMTVRPGTPVAIEGPYGIFSERARTRPDVVLIGIGIGIAPIRALLEAAHFVPGGATVILRSSSPAQLYLFREVEALCHARGAGLILLTGHRGAHRDGSPSWLPNAHADLRLSDLVPNLRDADLYVCGPPTAAALVVDDALASGMGHEQIHLERFAW